MKGKKKREYFLGGSAIGAINGLFGGGGGMVAVPLLEQKTGLSARCAHATAIAVILPASAVSGATYAIFGFVPLSILLPVALGAILGGFLGAQLLSRISPFFVTLLFAALMLTAGIKMVLP